MTVCVAEIVSGSLFSKQKYIYNCEIHQQKTTKTISQNGLFNV